VEDYNTATLASKKYYDLRRWEDRQTGKRQGQQQIIDPMRLNDEAEKTREI